MAGYTVDGVVHIDLKSSSPYNAVVSVSCRPLIHAVDDAELNKLELLSLIILVCGSKHIRYSFN